MKFSFKYLLLFLFVILIVALILFIKSVRISKNDKAIKEQFQNLNPAVQIIHSKLGLRALFRPGNKNNLLLLIHGAPGSLSDYRVQISDNDLLNKYSILSVDRPGYGESYYGLAETDIDLQAARIEDFVLEYYPDYKVTIAGHSYGGPVAARIAMRNNLKLDKLFLLASAHDPDNEKLFFFNRPLESPLLSWILSPELGVSNTEKVNHIESLKAIEKDWAEINIPIIVIHGEKDNIVPYENVAFLNKFFDAAQLKIINGDSLSHMIPWGHPEILKSALME